MVPRLAYPSSIFFLLNLSNFSEAGAQWLGGALEMHKKNVSTVFNYTYIYIYNTILCRPHF